MQASGFRGLHHQRNGEKKEEEKQNLFKQGMVHMNIINGWSVVGGCVMVVGT